ncbi:MAG: gfo/Idh/MocA family oxidoreductase [Sphingobacteriaceae bacterium]|jgi:predicted dehydrogenase|nr:gfo/Idh/MocA family oxidoreductase [Sphingobacteriaceae bacterium]
MKDKVRFAILGYGTIGKRYAEIITEMSDVSLTTLIDTNTESTGQESCAIYRSLDDFLLHDKDSDVIIVATPNGLHAHHAAKCLEAKKHVLLEKPVAFTAKEAEHLMSLAKKHRRLLFPVWQIRYSPIVAALKKLIGGGALGKPLWVQANCFWNRGEGYYNNHPWHGTLSLDGGPLYTQFSHVIDLFSWLFGDVVPDEASFCKVDKHVKTEFEDTGVVNLRLGEECAGSLSYTVSAPAGTSTSELTIITENARIQVEGKYFENLTMLNTDDAEIEAEMRRAVKAVPADVAEYCRRRLVEDVCGAVLSGSRRNDKDIGGATGLIEEIYKGRTGTFELSDAC